MREYMKDAEFKERYNLACRELVREAARQAQQTLSPALRTLRTIVEDEGEQTQARITAARTMLEYSLKLSEHADILEQLRELEKWRDNFNGNN